MRTSKLALATVLAATALSVQAGPRMESAVSPFTYEALGATPTLTFGRARSGKAEAPKPDAARRAAAPAPRTGGTAAFTYDAVGATPHVDLRRQPASREAQAPAAAD